MCVFIVIDSQENTGKNVRIVRNLRVFRIPKLLISAYISLQKIPTNISKQILDNPVTLEIRKRQVMNFAHNVGQVCQECQDFNTLLRSGHNCTNKLKMHNETHLF